MLSAANTTTPLEIYTADATKKNPKLMYILNPESYQLIIKTRQDKLFGPILGF